MMFKASLNDRRREAAMACRRTFLKKGLAGVGAAAYASLAAPQAFGKNDLWSGYGKPGTHVQRIKRVIHLCMAGGPSHFETFDNKVRLAEMDGQPMPSSFTQGQPIAQLQGKPLVCLGPQHPFKRCGKSGLEVTSILPHIGGVADDICVIRSMTTDQINHDPAHTFFNTGTILPNRPSIGSWLLYGLGAESNELPGYVVLISEGGGQSQPIAARQWHSGFLPSRLQGVQFQSKGIPVHYVKSPPGISKGVQGRTIDALSALNKIADQRWADPEIESRISQYEMAFRMQASVPELTDLSAEPKYVLDMYGANPGDGSFASNCLLARRLAERGVRFIQLYHRGWDHHERVKTGTAATARLVDQGTAALISDLKQRGMLDETLIIWGGEFGRTPMAQGDGRDHHIKGFSIFLAGGGVNAGTAFGATDELGYNAVENRVHVRDLHATLLYLMGIDHTRLTFKYQGLDSRLTGVGKAKILTDIIS